MAKIDLSKLSREQKIALLEALEEKERRSKELRDKYVPNSGQILVHKSDKEIRLVLSGNGSGKTALAVNESLWAATGYNPILDTFTPVPAKVIVVIDRPEKSDEVWIPEIKKWYPLKPEQCHKRGRHSTMAVTFENGSEIVFLSHHMDMLSFESIELDFCVADEPCPRHIWIGLKRGGRKAGTKARYLMVGTPISAAWVRTDLVEPAQRGELKDIEVFVYGSHVNEANLAEGYIESFSRVLTEKEKRVRLHGEFFDSDGLALAHLFDETVHLIDPIEWREEWPVVVAVDPHPSKAHVACMLGVDDKGYLYYIKELSAKQVAKDFAQTLKRFMNGYRVIDIVSDSLGSADSTGGEGFKSFIHVLQENGIHIRATSWEDKSEEDFIDRIRSSLAIPVETDNYGQKTPKLRIFRGNPGIVGDIRNVSWLKQRYIDEYKPKLDITYRDYLSALKYALATNLVPNKHKAKIYAPKALSPALVGRGNERKHIQRMRLRNPYRK